MKSRAWFICLALTCAAGIWAGQKPVAYRLASLPASAEQGQELVLCAANIGTGPVDVSLEFVNVKTGIVTAESTVSLAPLGSGAASQPCLTTQAAALGASGDALVVGVALVRKPLLSFREAQVTASIQVMAPDANAAMHTVETIPLSRTAHPSDGAPAYTPSSSSSEHHK
jgi:hypothetical protein